MISLLKYFRERWNNWVGDRDMELAIRQQLSKSGYYGRTAKLQNVRLVAVQRPGWLQVFRFEATARVRHPETEDEPAGPESQVPGSQYPDSQYPDSQYPDTEFPDAPHPEAQYHELFGLVRSDARKDLTAVRVFRAEADRRLLFSDWSEELICLRGAQGLSYTPDEQQVRANKQ